MRLKTVHDLIKGTERLNEQLHTPEFIVKKMKNVLQLFPEASIYLTLKQLSAYLMEDKNIKKIVDQEIDENFSKDEKIYPFFLLYCSIIVYVEYINIQKPQSRERKDDEDQ